MDWICFALEFYSISLISVIWQLASAINWKWWETNVWGGFTGRLFNCTTVGNSVAFITDYCAKPTMVQTFFRRQWPLFQIWIISANMYQLVIQRWTLWISLQWTVRGLNCHAICHNTQYFWMFYRARAQYYICNTMKYRAMMIMVRYCWTCVTLSPTNSIAWTTNIQLDFFAKYESLCTLCTLCKMWGVE